MIRLKFKFICIMLMIIVLLSACVSSAPIPDTAEPSDSMEPGYTQDSDDNLTEPPDSGGSGYTQDSDDHVTEGLETSEEDTLENVETISPFVNTPHGVLATQYISFINDYLPERIAFSYRELETARWISEELMGMGYTTADIAMQEFSVEAAHLSPRAQNPLHFFDIGDHMLRQNSQNVILTVPGRNEHKIIVGAHYDSLLYPGASDNASGMALLLESAHRMRYLDNYYTIVYVFFGAEEVWWLGAYYYLDQLSREENDNIKLMINADVLLDGNDLIYATGYGTDRNHPLTNAITTQIDRIATRLNTQRGTELVAIPHGLSINTDHAAFFYAGHTVMFLFGADYTQGSFHLGLFHSDRDDIHYIDANMPGRVERAMRTFSIFLEEVLLMEGA